jgi:hypothetical protein
MSANGQYVVFYSFADNLYPGSVLNAASGVYVRELAQGVTEREDVAADGTPANGSSYFGAISGDGRYVAFISTATNLVSGVSGTQLYLRDRKTSHTILISVSGDGSPANGNISSESISADGRYQARQTLFRRIQMAWLRLLFVMLPLVQRTWLVCRATGYPRILMFSMIAVRRLQQLALMGVTLPSVPMLRILFHNQQTAPHYTISSMTVSRSRSPWLMSIR